MPGWSRDNEVSAMKSNKFWIAILGVVIIISVVAAFMLRQAPANTARIIQDGKVIEVLSLSAVSEPYTFTVEYENGTNVIAVEKGRIRVKEADCHDGSCIRQGWISGGATPIVCLPHRLVIELEKSENPEVDAIER